MGHRRPAKNISKREGWQSGKGIFLGLSLNGRSVYQAKGGSGGNNGKRYEFITWRAVPARVSVTLAKNRGEKGMEFLYNKCSSSRVPFVLRQCRREGTTRDLGFFC